jgi:hypothetical protein
MTLNYDASIEAPNPGEDCISPVPGRFFTPRVSVRIITESSIWYLVPNYETPGGTYLRSPKIETNRPPTPSIGGRLDDGRWLHYEYALWSQSDLEEGEIRLNIKPIIGPAKGVGILTGVILEVTACTEVSSLVPTS